jgi:beta-glucosidase
MLLLAAVTAALPIAARADDPKTTDDPKEDSPAIRRLVEGYLSRMSLEDKLAEVEGIRPNDLLDEHGEVSLEKCRSLIPHGIGEICQFTTSLPFTPEKSRDMVRKIQHYLMTETPAGIPAMFHEEMITGFPAPGCTTYPQHVGIGCSWDPDLVRNCAVLTSESSRKIGCTHALSPMVDITRTAYWGRLEEGFGEDAVLTSRLGLSFVQGLQGTNLATGVAATSKHFAGYGAPQMSDAEFFDEILMPHEVAISKGNVACVMANYGTFRGIPSIANGELLTGILRGHLGFRGLTVSDYGAVGKLIGLKAATDEEDAAIKALLAGNDVELEHARCYPRLPEAIAKGLVPAKTLDEAVRRSLTLKARLGLLGPRPRFGKEGPLKMDPPASRRLAYRAAAESLVLLKNNGILPLGGKVKSIALVGPESDSLYSLIGDYTYQAMAAFWWNLSPDARNPRLVTLKEGLTSRLGDSVAVKQERGSDWCSPADLGINTSGDERLKKISQHLEKVISLVHRGLPTPDPAKALALAAGSDVIIAALGENIYLCGEGRKCDRIRLPKEQEDLLKSLLQTGKPVVLVLFGGRPLVLDGLEKQCAAVIEAWYPGEEGGNAIADLLTGTLNPSGRLCLSYPSCEDTNSLSYTDGYSGAFKPLYPFGYGLSFTTFAFSGLKVPSTAPLSPETIPVSLRVRNTGSRAGTEVVQLYVSPVDEHSPLRPLRLHGFQRVPLAPGEEKTVTFHLSPEQLCFWKDGSWIVEPGSYRIRLGSSSADLPLEATVSLQGERMTFPKRTRFWCDDRE